MDETPKNPPKKEKKHQKSYDKQYPKTIKYMQLMAQGYSPEDAFLIYNSKKPHRNTIKQLQEKYAMTILMHPEIVTLAHAGVKKTLQDYIVNKGQAKPSDVNVIAQEIEARLNPKITRIHQDSVVIHADASIVSKWLSDKVEPYIIDDMASPDALPLVEAEAGKGYIIDDDNADIAPLSDDKEGQK